MLIGARCGLATMSRCMLNFAKTERCGCCCAKFWQFCSARTRQRSGRKAGTVQRSGDGGLGERNSSEHGAMFRGRKQLTGEKMKAGTVGLEVQRGDHWTKRQKWPQLQGWCRWRKSRSSRGQEHSNPVA